MGAAIVAIFVVVFLVVLLGQSRRQAKDVEAMEKLLASGSPAQALLLSVSGVNTTFQRGTQRYERRLLKLDIEEPGQEPYEVHALQLIPAYLSQYALPGATFEVRVDQRKRGKVALVGPCAGFSPEFTGGNLEPRLFLPTSRL